MSYRIKNKDKHKAIKVESVNVDPVDRIENAIIFVIITAILMALLLKNVEHGYFYTSTILKMPRRMLNYGIVFGVITVAIYIIGFITRRLKTVIPFIALGLFLCIYCVVMWKLEYSIPKFKLQYMALIVYFVAAMAYLIFQYCILLRRKKNKNN